MNSIHILCHAMLCCLMFVCKCQQQVKAGRRGIDMVSAEARKHLKGVGHTYVCLRLPESVFLDNALFANAKIYQGSKMRDQHGVGPG